MTPSLRTVGRCLAGSLLSISLVLPTQAALFTDVPDGSLYQGAVEGLTFQRIVNGYPDGTYGPRKPVNRAEFLQLLFRAAGLEADPADRLCFTDVPAGAWFEGAVCTAKSRGIVRGYDDSSFKPAKEVTRGEAVKMLSVAFGLAAPDHLAVGLYTDIPLDRWDAPYIAHLLERGVLPLTGQESATAFHSEWSLTRGDAALLLWATLQSLQRLPTSTSSSSSSSSSSSAASESSSVSSAASSSSVASSTSSSSSASATPGAPSISTVVVPFTKEGESTRRASALYRFTIDATKTVSLTVKKGKSAIETPTCRLFRLRSDGISNEYYFGTISAGSCLLKVTIAAGDYQLEVGSQTATSFTVTAADAKSDGNDGFSEAKLLKFGGTVMRGSFADTDYGQYYKFNATESQLITLELISEKSLQCLIFPGDDVELASFSGPTCNEAYLYPKGSYTVWVGQDPAAVSRASFSIRLF